MRQIASPRPRKNTIVNPNPIGVRRGCDLCIFYGGSKGQMRLGQPGLEPAQAGIAQFLYCEKTGHRNGYVDIVVKIR